MSIMPPTPLVAGLISAPQLVSYMLMTHAVGAGVNLGRTGEARHKVFGFISTQLSDMNINYTLPAFQSSASSLPEGLAFARPNAIGPGATRTGFRRSTGFDPETGGGGDGSHGNAGSYDI